VPEPDELPNLRRPGGRGTEEPESESFNLFLLKFENLENPAKTEKSEK